MPNASIIMAAICSLFGVIAFLSPITRLLNFRTGFSLALDFWMAAGLLKLSSAPSWPAILTSAALILIRKTSTLSLRTKVTSPTYVRETCSK